MNHDGRNLVLEAVGPRLGRYLADWMSPITSFGQQMQTETFISTSVMMASTSTSFNADRAVLDNVNKIMSVSRKGLGDGQGSFEHKRNIQSQSPQMSNQPPSSIH